MAICLWIQIHVEIGADRQMSVCVTYFLIQMDSPWPSRDECVIANVPNTSLQYEYFRVRILCIQYNSIYSTVQVLVPYGCTSRLPVVCLLVQY